MIRPEEYCFGWCQGICFQNSNYTARKITVTRSDKKAIPAVSSPYSLGYFSAASEYSRYRPVIRIQIAALEFLRRPLGGAAHRCWCSDTHLSELARSHGRLSARSLPYASSIDRHGFWLGSPTQNGMPQQPTSVSRLHKTTSQRESVQQGVTRRESRRMVS